MKLRRVVLDVALPREVQPTQETWTQVVPSAQYTSDKCELDYDPASQLVTIKSKYSTRCVHASRVLFMEPEPVATNDAWLPKYVPAPLPTPTPAEMVADMKAEIDSPVRLSGIQYSDESAPKVDKRTKAYRERKREREEAAKQEVK